MFTINDSPWTVLYRTFYSFIHGLLLAIIIIVVAVKEIYDENTSHGRNVCKGIKEDYMENTVATPFPTNYEKYGHCYNYSVTYPGANCYIPVGIVQAGTVVEFRESSQNVQVGAAREKRQLKIDQTMNLNVEVDFTNYFDDYQTDDDLSEVPYGGFEIWSKEEVIPAPIDGPPNLADSVNMMKYILGGLCGGLLALILIMFLFTRFIYPRFGGRSVRQNPNQTVLTSDRTRNLPGLSDLPPGYDNIAEYPKVENESSPPPYVLPPAYSEIGTTVTTQKPE